jgi:hypothetical protein
MAKNFRTDSHPLLLLHQSSAMSAATAVNVCSHHMVPPITLLSAYSHPGAFFSVNPAYVTYFSGLP